MSSTSFDRALDEGAMTAGDGWERERGEGKYGRAPIEAAAILCGGDNDAGCVCSSNGQNSTSPTISSPAASVLQRPGAAQAGSEAVLSIQEIDAKLLSYWQPALTINQLPQPIWNRSNRTSLIGWPEGPSLTERRTRRSSGE